MSQKSTDYRRKVCQYDMIPHESHKTSQYKLWDLGLQAFNIQSSLVSAPRYFPRSTWYKNE